MSKIDQDLVAALKRAKTKPMTEPMYFALVLKAPGEGTLIVNKNPVKPAAIAEAKKDLGGGQIFKGRCAGDKSGQLVFETAKVPPAYLAKTLKSVIIRDAGLTLKVDAHKAADLSDDDDSTADPTTATPKADDKAAKKEALLKRLKALTPAITRALATKGPNADAVRTQLAKVKSLIDGDDLDAAAKALDELEKLLGQDPVEVDNRDQVMYCYDMGKADGQERSPSYRAKIDPADKKCLESYDEGYDEGLKLPAKADVKRTQWTLLKSGEWSGDSTLAIQGGKEMRFRVKNLNDQEAKFRITSVGGGLPPNKSFNLAPQEAGLVLFSVNAPKPVDWTFEISTKPDGTPVLHVQWELFTSDWV